MPKNTFLTIVVGLLVVLGVLSVMPSDDSPEPSAPSLASSSAERTDASSPDPSPPSPYDADFDPSPAAVAQRAAESDVPIPNEAPRGYYQPEQSLAKGMTPEWRKFAETVDKICGLTYNYLQAESARTVQEGRARGWSVVQAEAALLRLNAEQGEQIVKATNLIGPPPAKPALFRSWQANVAQRRDLKFEAIAALRHGDPEAARSIMARVDGLKVQSDKLGQRFGLRICTSN